MRGYVFTREERKILNTYIKNGSKTKHFNVIMTLIRRNQRNLEEDMKRLSAVNKKINSARRRR